MGTLTRKRGDSFANEYEITSAATGAVVNITSYTFVMSVDSRQNPSDTSTQVFTVNGVITDAPAGLVEFAPSAAQTDVTPGIYFYDAQLTDDVGRIRTFDSGRYIIEQDYSK